MSKNKKISDTLKRYYNENGHHLKGCVGRKQTDEQKEHLRKKAIEAADKRGRLTAKQKAARNKANVYAYRARKYNAIVESSDLALIKKIYEYCPDGYHVDHIQSLATGGLHHQDNLQYLECSENCRKNKDRNYDRSKAIAWAEIVPE